MCCAITEAMSKLEAAFFLHQYWIFTEGVEENVSISKMAQPETLVASPNDCKISGILASILDERNRRIVASLITERMRVYRFRVSSKSFRSETSRAML